MSRSAVLDAIKQIAVILAAMLVVTNSVALYWGEPLRLPGLWSSWYIWAALFAGVGLRMLTHKSRA